MLQMKIHFCSGVGVKITLLWARY